MNNLYSRSCVGCIVLVLVFSSPAVGAPDELAGVSSDYLATTSTSASGWTTVTLVPLKVECERILRSVTMDVFALGGAGAHRHKPAKVTCDEGRGHFSVGIDMDGDAIPGRTRDDEPPRQSAVYVAAQNAQTAHGSGGGHKDHQHVVHIFHDLE